MQGWHWIGLGGGTTSMNAIVLFLPNNASLRYVK